MRQAGLLAAAGIYALENNVRRLAQDHLHTQQLASALATKDFTGEILPVETNIVIFEVKGRLTPKEFAAILQKHNIRTIAISPTQVRMVVHLDITPEMVQQTINLIQSL
jgi:threonine aldolase